MRERQLLLLLPMETKLELLNAPATGKSSLLLLLLAVSLGVDLPT